MARWALGGRPLPWPLGKWRAGGLGGVRPREIVIAKFVGQLPGSTTGWGAGADLRGWGPWAVPWGEQVWVQLHLVVGVRVGVWR